MSMEDSGERIPINLVREWEEAKRYPEFVRSDL